jgi:CopG family transcriptional regulator / antitoxin EndoAI
MPDSSRKVLVSLPDALLQQMDKLMSEEHTTRSQIIRDAMKLYIREKHRMEIRERMRLGYEEMARINEEWAESGLLPDVKTLELYETLLAECEE